MQLARVFIDYMVLQRQMPILIWGKSRKTETVEIKINQTIVCTANIAEGDFSFLIPPQEAAENVLLEVGEIRLEHIDIGEVWVAGGQSNMEFMMKYTEGGEKEITSANDEHLRTYIVGQYSFQGEREAGYKAWNPWNRWLTYVPGHAPELPATAVYFAKSLRKSGIPVGILSCNWGGTSASAWIKKEYLSKDDVLKVYVDEFEESVAKLDLDRYEMIKSMIRPAIASQKSRKAMDIILKNTYKPMELKKMILRQSSQKSESSDEKKTDHMIGQENAYMDFSHISIEEIRTIGPGEPNEPGTLYENMLQEIVGYSVRGVIWYQGETDEKKAEIYARLFSSLIQCWREEWNKKNAAVEKLPFLFVQLAPFGTWMENSNKNFPVLREQQEQVSKNIPDICMTSISDIGNIYDIHPQNKKTVGERLALLAEKYVYGRSDILADGKMLMGAVCRIIEDKLLISAEVLRNAKEIRVEFAQTGFYQVNLYNGAGIPVKPFKKNLAG